MGNSIQAVQQFFTDTWDAAVSLLEGEGDSEINVEKQGPEKKAVENSFSKRPGFGELRRMESRRSGVVRGESLTRLCVSGDDHLNKEYAEVDTALDNMAAKTKEAIRETLSLKPGQKIPGPLNLHIGVSTDSSGHKTLRLQSVKADQPGFRYRIKGDIPIYRTSADLSIAAQRKVSSVGFPPHVDLSKITNDLSQIVLRIQPDGRYELVLPEDKETTPGNCDPKPSTS